MVSEREDRHTPSLTAQTRRSVRWLTQRPLFKATAILHEYTSTLYFPIHGVSRIDRIRVWPRLMLLEYLVYRVDAIAERNRQNDLDVTRTSDYALLHRYKANFAALLRRLGAWSPATADLLDDAEAFARVENALTARLTPSEDALRRVTELRPTDVRLLHSACLAMLHRQDDPALRRALWPVEVLADIANDLEHYGRDVANKNFNVLAAHQALHGSQAEIRLRETIEQHRAEFGLATQALGAGRCELVRAAGAALLRDRLGRFPPRVEP